jgi:hypothetical protein
VRVTRDRGALMAHAVGDADAVVTLHPSAILRARDDVRDVLYDQLVDDLQLASRAVAERDPVRR